MERANILSFSKAPSFAAGSEIKNAWSYSSTVTESLHGPVFGRGGNFVSFSFLLPSAWYFGWVKWRSDCFATRIPRSLAGCSFLSKQKFVSQTCLTTRLLLAWIPYGLLTDVYTRGCAENFAASQHVTIDTKDQYVMIALPSGSTNMT